MLEAPGCCGADGVHPDAGSATSAADRLMLELTNAQIGGWIASSCRCSGSRRC
ncbi:hypothetical protein P4114_28960 [Pseudomonas aeruginosa]|nr:hypothetical protein [Pseudomonas aeruginosa]